MQWMTGGTISLEHHILANFVVEKKSLSQLMVLRNLVHEAGFSLKKLKKK